MSKLVKFLIVVSMVTFGFQNVCHANPMHKLGRGVTYLAFFPMEIPKHMIYAASEATPDWAAPFYGIFYGIPKGAGYGVTRLLAGVLNIVTFPLNIPKNWGDVLPVGPFSFGETKHSILNERS